MEEPNVFDWIAGVLTILGGINWGLVGLFNFDLVAFFLGTIPLAQKIVYVLVGISACYMIYFMIKEAM